MEEKQNYNSKQVAQICMAFLNAYGQNYFDANEMNKFLRFVPRNVKNEISNLRILTENIKDLRDAHEKIDYKNLDDFKEFLAEYYCY